MLRSAIAAGSSLGRRVRPILENGLLVPDDLMVELIRERLDDEDARDGFILDGFPRTLAQASALDDMLREIDRGLTLVFELQVPDSLAEERLRRRAHVEGRSDDSPDAIRTRLDLYHRETEPLVEHYRARGNLVGIHADRTVNEVFSEMSEAIEQVPT
jgi:adenylate kinase